MRNKFICEENCPMCGAEVQMFGSECYNEEGIEIECMNDDCDYRVIIRVECNIAFSGMRDVVEILHSEICQRIMESGEI